MTTVQDFDALDAVVATRSTQPASSLQARGPRSPLPQQHAQLDALNPPGYAGPRNWHTRAPVLPAAAYAAHMHNSSQAHMDHGRQGHTHAWPDHGHPGTGFHGPAANPADSKRPSTSNVRPSGQAPSQTQPAQDRNARPPSSRQTNIGPMLQKAAQVHQATQAHWASLDHGEPYHTGPAASAAPMAPGSRMQTAFMSQASAAGNKWQQGPAGSSGLGPTSSPQECIDLTANDGSMLGPCSGEAEAARSVALTQGGPRQGMHAALAAAAAPASLQQALRPGCGQLLGTHNAAAVQSRADATAHEEEMQQPAAANGEVLVPCSTANYGMRLHRSALELC